MSRKSIVEHRDIKVTDEVSIGARLRTLRRERKLSVAELALKAGVSAGGVSQIERGIANPSLRTLERIRAALDVPLMTLLEEMSEGTTRAETAKEPDFVRRSHSRPSFGVGPHGLAKQILSPGSAIDGLHFMIITVPPGVCSEEVLIGPGEKAGLVLKGKTRLVVDGTPAILFRGDSFQFASTVTHSLHNDEAEEAEVLWIMSMKTPMKQL